jgi:hypothetical protein
MMRYVEIPNKPPLITGMCLENHCDKDDMRFYLTMVDDIFAKDPPLSPGQLAAEQTLKKTGTQEFWLRAAAANHVSDTREILAGLNMARESIRWVEKNRYASPPPHTAPEDDADTVQGPVD